MLSKKDILKKFWYATINSNRESYTEEYYLKVLNNNYPSGYANQLKEYDIKELMVELVESQEDLEFDGEAIVLKEGIVTYAMLMQSIDMGSCYSVNFEMTDIDEFLERYFDKYNLELNPDFQRGHVWTEKQQRSYIEFILRGGVKGRDIYFNHPNYSNSRGTNGNELPMVCVDGLQRITAMQRFVRNELTVFDGLYRRDIRGRIDMSVNKMTLYINGLGTREEILKWYVEINSTGVAHTKEELERVKALK